MARPFPLIASSGSQEPDGGGGAAERPEARGGEGAEEGTEEGTEHFVL